MSKSTMQDMLEALRLLQVGWIIAFSVLLPLLGGVWLDRQFGTSPCLAFVGVIVGILLAVVGVARVLGPTYLRYQGKSRKDEEKD